MKLLILYCIASLAVMCARAQKVNVHFKNTSFREVIRQIEKQSPYTFVYTSEQIQKIPNANINADSLGIRELINKLLQNAPLGYLIDGNFIVLVSKTEQTKTIRGRIVTNAGLPVEGATIYVRQENLRTITGADGSFELSQVTAETSLNITGAEILAAEIKVGTADFLDIKVQQQIRELDETIILGYGSTTRRFSTGNAVKINTAEMKKLPGNDLLQFLRGKAPGLIVTSTGTAPGSSSLIQIRGQHSLNPNPLINYLIPPVDQPFIVLNGIPFAPQNNNANQLSSISSPGSLEVYQNPYGGISSLGLLNPADIESIEILKDAVATSLYGSRSANGVVLITTKQPAGEKLSVETILSSGMTLRRSAPEMLSTSQYLEMRRIAFSNDNIQPGLTERSFSYAPDLLAFDSSRQVDWSHHFFHKATPFFNGHIRLSGSLRRVLFTSSVSVRNEDHLLRGNFVSKQLSSNQQVRYQSSNNRLNVTSAVYYATGKNVSTGAAALLRVISLPPNYPELYDHTGKLTWEYRGLPLTENPAAYLLQTYTIHMSAIQATTKMDYLFAKGFSFSFRTGYSGFTTSEASLIPPASLSQQQQRNIRSLYGTGKFATTVVEPQLEYKWSTKKITLLMMSGATLQHHSISLESKRGTGYSGDVQALTLSNATRIDQRQIEDKNKYESLLARISLQVAGRYILDMTGRRENSSHFSSTAKTGLFSSAGAAWIFTEEPFLKKNLSFINYGKLRVSYGTTGNDNIGYSHFRDSWSRVSTYTSNQATPDNTNEIPFGWSVTQKAEAAIECYALNNQLSVIIASYFHRTGKQLISQLSSNQNTSTRYILNYPAIVQNRGFELTVAYRSGERDKFKWSSAINITSHKNSLRHFEGLATSLYAGRYWEGFPLETKQPLRFTGADPATGVYHFQEDPSNYVSTVPSLYGGLAQTIGVGRWKADLQFDFRFQTGINYLRSIYNLPPGSNINQPSLTAGFWRSPGDLTQIQKPTVSISSPAQLASFLIPGSDAIYSDASFLRLNQVSVSYAVGHKNKANIPPSIQLYIQLQNILTISGFPLADPESQRFYSYPQGAMVSAGIIIKN
ncbi:MAG: SusC/RagA family TonB-linked outer membrane protein [Chitinophagaceae bacterium]